MGVDIENFVIINALGELDDPNAPASVAASGALAPTSAQLTIDERALADAHASGVTAIARLLDERGYSSTRIEKILGLNFLNYAKAVWGA